MKKSIFSIITIVILFSTSIITFDFQNELNAEAKTENNIYARDGSLGSL